MNWHEPQDDALDELLHKAQWPEPPLQQLERLQSNWHRTVRRRKRWQVASVAVCALIPLVGMVGFLAIWHGRQPMEKRLVERRTEMTPTQVDDQPPTKKSTDDTAVVQHVERSDAVRQIAVRQIVREPNAYEQMLVSLHRQQIGAAKVAMNPPETTVEEEEGDIIATAVQRLADDPQLHAASVAKEIAAIGADHEAQLRRWIRDHAIVVPGREDSPETAAKRHAALRLLGITATHESAPLLLVAMRDNDCPDEILQAVARLSSTQQLAAQARSEASAARQRFWLAALLERGTSQAVSVFLELVNEPATSAAALTATADVGQAPVEELFAALAGPRVRIREAAARVLGSLNDPAVSKRLVEMAMNAAHRREALIALMSSSDPVARQFLDYAQRDLALAASVRAIRHRYSLLQSVN